MTHMFRSTASYCPCFCYLTTTIYGLIMDCVCCSVLQECHDTHVSINCLLLSLFLLSHYNYLWTNYGLCLLECVARVSWHNRYDRLPFTVLYIYIYTYIHKYIYTYIYIYTYTANPTWGDIFECCFKAQSSKLERLFSVKRGKRDVRALSFELSKMTSQAGLAVLCLLECVARVWWHNFYDHNCLLLSLFLPSHYNYPLTNDGLCVLQRVARIGWHNRYDWLPLTVLTNGELNITV